MYVFLSIRLGPFQRQGRDAESLHLAPRVSSSVSVVSDNDHWADITMEMTDKDAWGDTKKILLSVKIEKIDNNYILRCMYSFILCLTSSHKAMNYLTL